MSLNTMHEEENFWPSISDMFLSLFIIALALFSVSTWERDQEQNDGDLKMVELVVMEANEIGQYYPELGLCSVDVTDRNQSPKYSDLAQHLKKIWDISELQDIIQHSSTYQTALQQSDNDDFKTVLTSILNNIERLDKPTIDALDNYRDVIRVLSKSLDLNSLDKHEGNYALAMKEIKNKLLPSLQEKDDDLTSLNKKITELERERDSLKYSNQDLNRQIAELEQERESLKYSNQGLNEKITELERNLLTYKGTATYEDKRRDFMDKVEKKVTQFGIADKCTIERENGILRIPASSISFQSNEFNVFEPNSFTDPYKLLDVIGQILAEIAQENINTQELANIIIESHADDSPTGSYKYGNEELSSMRALYVWTLLNKNERLSPYGQLFSHAGFGARVPLPKELGEFEDSWKIRCRRIDIRFSCTPDFNHQRQ